MRFVKMHGAGNDFAVIDARHQERDWPALAQRMCDRHFGVGGDGIILVEPSTRADLRMRIFNPDGSEAEMCGNGIRCFTRYVIEQGLAEKSAETDGLSIETLAGLQRVFPIFDNGIISRVKVNMGPPTLTPASVPVVLGPGYDDSQGPVLDYPLEAEGHKLSLAFVSMGNPHAVALLDTPVDDFPLLSLGPDVEHHSMFPHRVNFEVVNVLDRGHLRVRVWERGAGATLACGSGACAAMVAARLQGRIEDRVDVELPGGVLTVAWDPQGDVWMEGPVAEVFQGEWTESDGA